MPQDEHDRRIDYIEFPVPNVSAAKKFYSSVFGWLFTDYGPDYTSSSDGRLAGGFATSSEVILGGPLLVLYALDLSSIQNSIVSNGGTVTKEPYDFPGGRRFHFRDPFGYGFLWVSVIGCGVLINAALPRPVRAPTRRGLARSRYASR